jgi:hypothetical protein
LLVTQGILRETSWIPILIGTLTGFGAWLLAEPMANAWQRGALVAAIALTATYFTQQGTSSALEHGFDLSAISVDEIFFPDAPAPVQEPSASQRSESADWNPPPPRLDLAADSATVSQVEPPEQPVIEESATAEIDVPQPSPEPDRAGDSETSATESASDGPAVADTSVASPNPPAQMQPMPPTIRAGGQRDPPAPDQGMMVALSYALGTLAAYLLGRGPELRAGKEEAIAPAG